MGAQKMERRFVQSASENFCVFFLGVQGKGHVEGTIITSSLWTTAEGDWQTARHDTAQRHVFGGGGNGNGGAGAGAGAACVAGLCKKVTITTHQF